MAYIYIITLFVIARCLSEPLIKMIYLIFTDFVGTGLAPVLKINERTRIAVFLHFCLNHLCNLTLWDVLVYKMPLIYLWIYVYKFR